MNQAWRAEQEAWDEHAFEEFDEDTLRKARPLWRPVHELILAPFGDLTGTSLLDCGCGVGFLARVAAEKGAEVTAFDVSSGSILAGERLAERVHSNLSFVTAIFEKLPFADGAFSAATGQFILHHVDLKPAAEELARVLAPGASVSFLETWQANPLVRLGRRMRGRAGIAKYGTDDESPLLPANLATLRQAGLDVSVQFPIFIFFRLISHNLLRGRPIFAPLAALLKGLDWVVGLIPPLRRFSYYALLVGTKVG